jgi:hypothetical protein
MLQKHENLDLVLAGYHFQTSVSEFKSSLKSLGYCFHRDGFLAYKKARGLPVVFEALHGFNNHHVKGVAELKTAQIAYWASKFSRGGSVLALLPRSICDLNRNDKARRTLSYKLDRKLQKEGAVKYPDIMAKLIKSHKNFNDENGLTDTFLVVSIHGMKNRKTRDVDIGSGRGSLCYKGVALWFGRQLRRKFADIGFDYKISIDRGFSGGAHPKILRSKAFLGPKLQYLQIEFSRRLRKEHSLKIAYLLSEIAQQFANRKWVRREKSEIPEKSLSISCSIRFVGFKKGTPVNRIYMDRYQRISLGLKRGQLLKMLVGQNKTLFLEIHQAKYFQIGENKILLDKKLKSKLHLSEGDKVTIINYK